MSILKLLKSKPMPDKNAPEYRERYEREVAYGRKFADISGISWAARKIQKVADAHRVGFLVTVFGFVIMCFTINLYRIVKSYQASEKHRMTATQRMDAVLHQKKVHEKEEIANFQDNR